MKPPEVLNEWSGTTTTTLEASTEPTLDIETTLDVLEPLTNTVQTVRDKKGEEEHSLMAENLAGEMAKKIPPERRLKMVASLADALPELLSAEYVAAEMLLSRVAALITHEDSSL